jgi:conjugative transfer signal peptidase TraF
MNAKARRGVLWAFMTLGTLALCMPEAMTIPIRIVYNPSDSVARGWYRVGDIDSANPLHSGSIVLARLPASAAALAAQRGYLPAGVPILKRIGAVAPQVVCVRERIVRIDDAAVATVRLHDGAFRSMPSWTQCGALAEGELFLLSDTNPASFDSRYFGPIAASAVIGVAQPLWTWSSP